MHNNFAWKYLTREAGPTRLIPVQQLEVGVDVESLHATIEMVELTVEVVSSIEATGQENLFSPTVEGI